MDKDHSNKVNTGENKIDEMAVSINNKHANDDSVFDSLIAFPKKRKRDTNELNRNTTDEENLNFSDTEISNAVCNNYSDDVTTDEFEDQDDYSLRESPKKRLIINEKTCSHMTKTADLCTLDYSDENDLPDLPITSNKVVEYVFTSVNSPQYNTNYSNFESQINIPELSNVDRTENKIEDSSCPECSACFKNPWNYQRHIKRSHKGCKDCSQAKICAYRSSNTHPELITTTKPFECSECQYVCTSKGNFKRHMLNHSIEKQLECNICGYRCTGGGQLHRHMFVHKGGGKHFDFWPLSNMY
ncbi:unnamed protein product [Meganyctiphanes norvegica]|uniref:C2H2-type domain-containing protein n=1 Tax=Meganyctiphanes norvegica TaxID=48144 RepID=A0AAV2Q027_MEGNR